METELIGYRRSATIAEIGAAMSLVQGQLRGAVKDSKNPHLNSTYADLESCWEACREALAANGVAVIQPPRSEPGAAIVTTMLLHKSGEFIEADLRIPMQQNTAQGLGSAITYGRRYGLCGMVGIAPADDDGHEASTAKPRARRDKAADAEQDPYERGSAVAAQEVAERKLAEQKRGAVAGKSAVQTMMDGFALMKRELGEEQYRFILGQHGAKKSNEFIQNIDVGRKCYQAMANALKAKRAATDPPVIDDTDLPDNMGGTHVSGPSPTVQEISQAAQARRELNAARKAVVDLGAPPELLMRVLGQHGAEEIGHLRTIEIAQQCYADLRDAMQRVAAGASK